MKHSEIILHVSFIIHQFFYKFFISIEIEKMDFFTQLWYLISNTRSRTGCNSNPIHRVIYIVEFILISIIQNAKMITKTASIWVNLSYFLKARFLPRRHRGFIFTPIFRTRKDLIKYRWALCRSSSWPPTSCSHS